MPVRNPYFQFAHEEDLVPVGVPPAAAAASTGSGTLTMLMFVLPIAFILVMSETCYGYPGVMVLWLTWIIALVFIVSTCGGYTFYWIHGNLPWIIMLSFLFACFAIVTIKEESVSRYCLHGY
jgi:hypothetical protein